MPEYEFTLPKGTIPPSTWVMGQTINVGVSRNGNVYTNTDGFPGLGTKTIACEEAWDLARKTPGNDGMILVDKIELDNFCKSCKWGINAGIRRRVV